MHCVLLHSFSQLLAFKSHHQALLQSINMIDPLLVKEHLFGWMKEMLSMAQYGTLCLYILRVFDISKDMVKGFVTNEVKVNYK